MALQRYLTLNQATSILNTSLSNLNRLIQSGTIRAIEIAGETFVSETSLLTNRRKEDLPEYQKFAHLAGQEIWISEAERKYDVPNPTIHRWIKKGYITIIGKDKNRVVVDEQDVAYCTEIYKNRVAGRGKWLFNPDGTPYIPKTEQQEEKTPA